MSYGDYLRNKYHHAAVKIADAEGVPCVLEYSKGKNIRNYEIYGNSVQDGTPTPDTPIDIQSVGDLTTKNLLPNDWESGFISTSSGANQSSSTYVRTKDYFTFDIAKNYYISSDSIDTSTTISWYFYDENKNFISRVVSYKDRTIGTSDCNVTVPTNAVFFRLAVLTTDTTIKVQIEEGSIATEYEPYHKYDIPITVAGKNLLKYPYYWTSRVRSGIMFTVNGDGTITLNGTTTLSGTSADDFILAHKTKIESGTYTVSGCPSGGSTRKYRILLNIKDSSGNPKYISDIGNGATFTVTDTSTMTASIRIEAEIGTVNNLVFAPQIELGSTATEYELYKGETKHIYLDEPLKKVGDYADYIDFKNQKVVRNAAEATLNGSETWAKTSDTSEGVYQGFALSNSAYNIPKGNNLVCFSDKFPYLSLSSAVEKNTIIMRKNSAYTLRIIIGAEYVPDLELSTFKTWLSMNNVKIVYPLAAPTEESIALPALKTFKGTSIILADTTVLPSNIKAKYVRT